MTTGTAEVTSLEELDLAGVPPCGAFRFDHEYPGGPFWPCRESSVIRIRFRHCVNEVTLFVCAECLRRLKAGRIRCADCGSMRGDYEWREI